MMFSEVFGVRDQDLGDRTKIFGYIRRLISIDLIPIGIYTIIKLIATARCIEI